MQYIVRVPKVLRNFIGYTKNPLIDSRTPESLVVFATDPLIGCGTRKMGGEIMNGRWMNCSLSSPSRVCIKQQQSYSTLPTNSNTPPPTPIRRNYSDAWRDDGDDGGDDDALASPPTAALASPPTAALALPPTTALASPPPTTPSFAALYTETNVRSPTSETPSSQNPSFGNTSQDLREPIVQLPISPLPDAATPD